MTDERFNELKKIYDDVSREHAKVLGKMVRTDGSIESEFDGVIAMEKAGIQKDEINDFFLDKRLPESDRIE